MEDVVQDPERRAGPSTPPVPPPAAPPASRAAPVLPATAGVAPGPPPVVQPAQQPPASPPWPISAPEGPPPVVHAGAEDSRWDETIPPCPQDAGEWFVRVYPEVSARDLGGTYNALLTVWGDLERAFGWEKSRSKAPWNAKTANRPAALDKWVKAGRTHGEIGKGIGPNIGAVAVFGPAWWQWWAKVQPSWHVKDRGRPNRFLRDTYPDADATSEPWAGMRHPGPNGALSFVATLYWWGMAVEEAGEAEDRESWAEAVREVKWMVTGLLAVEVGKRS
ncbi:hypothetical protein B0H13DRAFT_1587916 [Mycena leptocephala]|nr:hypothetical protein B0H13DRAFT_1587916 [Mycena leptocephala]